MDLGDALGGGVAEGHPSGGRSASASCRIAGRMFDEVIAYTADQARTPAMLEIERIVSSAPALHAAYLGRLDAVQDRIAAVLHDRAASAGDGLAVDDPTPRALVGAAFACFTAARQAFLVTGRPFAETTDRLMAAVRGPAAG